MGHRVYLIIRSGDDEVEAFEANNFLPWFWLTLLDRTALAATAPKWREWDRLLQAGDENEIERFDDVQPMLTDFWLEPSQVAANAARAQLYLRANYPELTSLYTEFVACLLAQMPNDDDDSVRLNLIALSNFSDAATQLADFEAQLASLEEGANLPGADWLKNQVLLTGFAMQPVPPEQYPALHRASTPSFRPPKPAEPDQKVQSYGFSLLAVLLGLSLIYASWRGYHAQKLSSAVLGTALLGLLFLAGAVAGLWRRARSSRKSRGYDR